MTYSAHSTLAPKTPRYNFKAVNGLGKTHTIGIRPSILLRLLDCYGTKQAICAKARTIFSKYTGTQPRNGRNMSFRVNIELMAELVKWENATARAKWSSPGALQS